MTCITCGGPLDDTSTTCPACGEPVASASILVSPTATGSEAPTAQAGGRTGVGDAGEGPEDPWGRGEGGGGPPPGGGHGSGGSGGGGYGSGGGGSVPPPGGADWGAPQPHPSGLSSEVRGWGIGAHLAGLLAGVATAAVLGFLGPLLVWLLKREDHPFIDHHGKEALNFQLTVVVAIVAGLALTIPVVVLGALTIGVGWLLAALVGVAAMIVWIAFPIMGAVKAANGEAFRYPISIRFIR